MPFLRSLTARTVRTVSIVLIGVLFVLQLVFEAQRVARISTHAPGTLWAWYATYAFIAALFFGVGSLIWLYSYAQRRMVATLLFGFCVLVMCAFGTLSGDALGDTLSNAVGSSASALAVLCLFLLLLRFPRNLLPRRAGRRLALAMSQVAVSALCLLSASYSILHDFFTIPLPEWWRFLGVSYYGIVGLGIVVIIVLAARRSPSVRTLQQTRLFFVGTLLSFVPILILTVLPALLHLYMHLDGTQSMIFLLFFPISLGYTLLRYEILVFDVYVRRVVTWLIGVVSLALLGYCLFAVSSQVIDNNVSLLLAGLIGAGVLGAPGAWGLARRLTERYFFPESLYYANRLRESHTKQGLETFDLLLAAHQLMLDVVTTLRSPEASIFILDEELGTFSLIHLPQREARGEQEAGGLLSHLGLLLTTPQAEATLRIAEQEPVIGLLTASPRPLFLSEVTNGAKATGLARYLKSRARGATPDPLLAAVKTPGGKLIGIVAVGERGDRQLYAGPELEALQRLIFRAASAIETARLYELTTRQQVASRRELQQAYEQQRQLNEQKDQFIIHISHELRTPLSEVTGYLDMLESGGEEIDAELRVLFVQKAQHGSEQLLKVVETVLDAVQSSFASPLPLHIEATALAPIVQDVIEHLDPQAARDHTIEVQIEESTRVLADAHALQLILGNLVSNALKYTPTGTPIFVRALIEQAGDADEPLVCIQVKDEGPGIPPSEVRQLFGKFARLQRDLSGSIRGTGLGLYINKQLVESMGGHIWVESSGVEGEGSLFAFTLRQAEVSHATDRSVESVLV
jgi:signal transduction histidine kinase